MPRLRSLTSKVILLTTLAIALTAGALWLAQSRSIWSELQDKQQEDAQRNVRTLAHLRRDRSRLGHDLRR